MKEKTIKRKIKDFLVINLGVCLMAFAYSFFVDPNNLIIGGVGGLATLLKSMLGDITILGFHIHSSLLILLLNVLLLIIGLIFISKDFFFKTFYASIIYPVYIFVFEVIIELMGDNFISLSSVVTELESLAILSDNTIKVIVAGAYLVFIVFGAFIAGFGLGLALKKGSSTGGVDIIQQILLNKFKIPFSVSLIIIDGLIVGSAALYYGDLLTILYGLIFIIVSGFVLDSVAFSGFNSRAVYIITKQPEKVKNKIYEVLSRGVTEFYAKSGYENKDFKLIVCVMSNKEFYKVKSLILEIDERAFIYVTRASEVHGEGFSYDLVE